MCPEKSIFCEIAWKNLNFLEIFLENRNFLTRATTPQISNQIDAAGTRLDWFTVQYDLLQYITFITTTMMIY